MSEEKKFISWSEFEAAIYALAEAIDPHPDTIVGVARGGLPGAVMLSHALDANLATIHANRDGEVGGLHGLESDDEALIFDEIADSGDTLKEVKNEVESQTGGIVKTATIHIDPDLGSNPDYWLEETGKWVVYPWEVSL